MARAKAKGATRAKTTAKTTKPSRKDEHDTEPGLWLNHASRIFTGVVLVGLVILLTVARGPLSAKAGEARQPRPGVSFAWPTDATGVAERHGSSSAKTWLSETVRNGLEAVALRSLTDDPFAPGALDAARVALIETGWMRDASLKRRADGVIAISGHYRLPGGVVTRHALPGQWLVARDGVLLEGVNEWSIPRIVGVRLDPPEYGQAWIGGEIDAALELLELLRTAPDLLEQVEAIDVSRFVSDDELAIITDTGGRVVFGGPPARPKAGEASTERKLANLRAIHDRTGRLDAGRPLVEAQFDEPLINRIPTGTP